MTRAGIVLLLVLACIGSAPAGEPEIGAVTEGVENQQTALIFGEGFAPGQTQVLCYFPEPWQSPRKPHIDREEEKAYQERIPALMAEQRRILERGLPALPETPPEGTQRLQILKVTPQVIAVVFTGGVKEPGAQCRILWVQTPAGLSRPYRVNRPTVWWKDRDVYEPGEDITLYGRSLASGLYRQRNYGLLRKQDDGKWYSARWGTWSSPHMDGHWNEIRLRMYRAKFRLPDNLPLGRYRFYMHNASGDRWGWSDPVDITVAKRPVWPRTVFDARNYGAAGTGLTDDTNAIQKALDAARDAGGGIVFLPAGTYWITRTLMLPQRTILKGVGRDNTRLVVPTDREFGARVPLARRAGDPDMPKRLPFFIHNGLVPMVRATYRFGIEDLTLERHAGDGMVVFMDNYDEPGEDVFIRRCRIVASRRWFPEGIYRGVSPVSIVARGDLQRFELDGCEIIGAGAVSKMGGMFRHARIVNNVFIGNPPYRSRLMLGGRGWAECVIMNNTVRRSERGMFMGGGTEGPGFVHNLIARNTMEENCFGANAGETYCIEAGRRFYYGPVAGASATSVRLPGAVLETEGPRNMPANRGGICLIVRGRGMGQYRWVLSNTADSITVAEPWRVVPDRTSVVCIMRGTVETLWIENIGRHGEAAMQMYDYWVNNVLDSHVSIDTEGVSLWGYEQEGQQRRFAPIFLNQVLNCKLRLRGWIRLIARTDPKTAAVDGSILVGNVIRNNQVYAPRRVSLNQRSPYWRSRGYRGTSVGIELMRRSWGFTPWPDAVATPAMDWTVVESNHIYDASVGIAIEGARHTILRRNRFDEVREHVRDDGEETLTIND